MPTIPLSYDVNPALARPDVLRDYYQRTVATEAEDFTPLV